MLVYLINEENKLKIGLINRELVKMYVPCLLFISYLSPYFGVASLLG